MLLNDPNPLRIGNLGMARAVHHVQFVDRRASLGVNSRKRYYDIFAIQAAKDIVKQTDPVGGLKFDERVSRMRVVVDCDSSRKFNSHRGARARALRFFDGWCEVKALALECAAQSLLDKLEIARAGNRLRFRVAYPKNAKRCVISTRENIGAQNVQRHDRK